MSVCIQITNGRYVKSGAMICHVCNDKIGNEDYLIEEHYVSKRGNEDDFNLNFHRKCSENKSEKCKIAWESEDNRKEQEKQLHIKHQNYKKAKKLLKSDYKYVELILNHKISK